LRVVTSAQVYSKGNCVIVHANYNASSTNDITRMDHLLQQLTSGLRTRLAPWLGGQGGPTTTVAETVWPLADALHCNRGLVERLDPDGGNPATHYRIAPIAAAS
jgi:hypothetical protein